MFNNNILNLTNPDRFSLPALENWPSPLKFISNQFRYISFPAVSLNSTEVHGHHVKSTFRSIWCNLVPNRQFELDLNLHFSYSRIRTIKNILVIQLTQKYVTGTNFSHRRNPNFSLSENIYVVLVQVSLGPRKFRINLVYIASLDTC